MLEDVRVTVSTVAPESRLRANVMRYDDLVSVAVSDELSDHIEAYPVIGEVDRRLEGEVGRFDPEEIELDDAAGIRQPEQPVELEYRPVHVTDNGSRGIAAGFVDQCHVGKRGIRVSSGMDVEGGSRFALRLRRRPQNASLELGPWMRAADFADDAGDHAAVSRASSEIIDYLVGNLVRGLGTGRG